MQTSQRGKTSHKNESGDCAGLRSAARSYVYRLGRSRTKREEKVMAVMADHRNRSQVVTKTTRGIPKILSFKGTNYFSQTREWRIAGTMSKTGRYR